MAVDRDGQNPTGYMGVNPSERPKNILANRAPTTTDRRFKIGTIWVDRTNNQSYQLTNVLAGSATWTLLGPGASDVDTLTGDSGGALSPTAGNMNILGGTNMTVAGAGSTLTVNMDAAISLATSVTSPIYTTSAADMNINSAAGQDIIMQMGDAAAANKISFEDNASAEVASLDSNGNFVALGYFTSAAAAGCNLVGATLTADGSDANIDLTFVPKGTGDNLFTAGDINASAGDIIASRSSASGDVTVECTNSDNTAADSDAFFEVAVGGTSGGNPGIRFQISGGQNYAMGIDNADSDKLVICADNDLGTDVLMKLDETSKDVEVPQGNVLISGAAKQLQVEGGAATDFIGQATLVAGTVTVANTNIAATDKIFVQREGVAASTALGVLDVSISAATSFTITALQPGTPGSTETNDVSIVNYFIVRQL